MPTPNLFVAAQTLVSPRKWFKRQTTPKSLRRSEHWFTPVPGTYEYIPGRGWYLTHPDETNDGQRLSNPIPVIYSRVLKRHLLKPDYDDRKLYGLIVEGEKPADIKCKTKNKAEGFFRLDDDVAWVRCWDCNGEFIPGPYELWCFDKRINRFRKMLKGDDPQFQSRRSSRSIESSVRSGDVLTSADNSTIGGAPSQPSTRPSSLRNPSLITASRASTRPSSPVYSRDRDANTAHSDVDVMQEKAATPY
ncbi:hypothetical protein M501DRAFT_1011748 [Patellaria atrata CBS 101060]|uniref:Uncharacterized protein n=1 Tax=Patellaria atrata CBS 101060 TaxID=1346257 RepID=A0A9P4VQ95_9PEZI|nr:hypothetical protein M501DRAFT_1011748 [Patellaria atrata CBS 101060]